MRERGWRPGSRIVTADEVPAGAEIGADLQIAADEPVVRLIRVRLANDSPMCLESVYLPAAGVPGLLEGGLEGSLYEKLARYGERPARAEQVVTATSVDGADAALLDIAPGSPALRIRRIGLNRRDHPIERTVSIYRADRYDVSFAVLRDE
nr:GntR family transcriptional regulator [Spelaeicoccus albus]